MSGVTVTQDRITLVRALTLDGVEPLLLQRGYSHGGKYFLPQRAVARWDHGELIRDIKLVGQVLLQDGTPGKATTDETYHTPASGSWKQDPARRAPAWLLELFGVPGA